MKVYYFVVENVVQHKAVEENTLNSFWAKVPRSEVIKIKKNNTVEFDNDGIQWRIINSLNKQRFFKPNKKLRTVSSIKECANGSNC